MNEIDDQELAGLLSDLADKTDEHTPEPVEPEVEEPEEESVFEDQEPTEPEVITKAKSKIITVSRIDDSDDDLPALHKSEGNDVLLDFLEDYKKIAKSISNNFEEDRSQMQTAIRKLMPQLDMDKPERVLVETLGIMIQSKSQATANAIRLMDSYTKLLAAGKVAEMLNGGEEVDDRDLRAIQAMLEEDE